MVPLRWSLMGIVSAMTASACWAAYVLGPSILDPSNTNWIWGDLSLIHLAWIQLLSDHESTWMSTTRFSYPLKLNTALFDPIPLFLLFAKLLHIEPDIHRQYIGLYFVLCLSLQALFAYLSIDKALQMVGALQTRLSIISTTSIAVIAATLPFTISRFQAHTALSSQWVLVMLIWTSLCSLGASRTKWAATQIPAVLFSSGINPYLSIMGVLNSLILQATTIKSIGWIDYTLRSVAALMAMSLGFWLFGFIGAADLPAEGYGIYSMNLLGPLDSNGLSRLLPIDVVDPTNGQTWEGFNYLGVGLIALFCLSILITLKQFISYNRITPEETRFSTRHFITAIIFFTLISLSSKISIASHAFDFPLPQVIADILSKFRASGRFFWMAGFLLIIWSTVKLARCLSPTGLAAIACTAMILQLVDIQPIGVFFRKSIQSVSRLDPLKISKKNVSMIYVYPPWQCTPHGTPGGVRNHESFGHTAAEAGIPTNSFYAARNPLEQLEYHCNIEARLKTIEKAALYILKNEIYAPRALLFQKTHACHQTGFSIDSTERKIWLGAAAEQHVFWICEPL